MRRWVWLLVVMGVLAGVSRAQPAANFATVEVVPAVVRVGEQASYVVTTYSDTLRDVVLNLPVIDGAALGGLRNFETSATVDGKQYTVVTFVQTFYPSRDGVLTIAPAGVTFESTVFADAVTLQTDSALATVEGLPDAPEGFSGLVGRHTAELTVEPDEVGLGQPFRVTYRLLGTGYVEGVNAPELSLPDGWRATLDPSSVVQASDGAAVVMAKTFRWRVVPDRSGRLSVGVAPLTVYDLPTGAFLPLMVEPVTVAVRVGANGETERTDVQAALARSSVSLPEASHGAVPLPEGWVWSAPLVMLAVAYGGAAAVRRVQAIRRAERQRHALAVARRAVAQAARVRGAGALMAIEAAAARYLREREAEMSDALRQALIRVESAKFAPEAEPVEPLAISVMHALEQLEREQVG